MREPQLREQCQIQGANCRGTASSVHHILPSSTHPELFFDAGNLQASCTACNSSGGAYLTNDRRRAIIEENQYLHSVVQAQQEQIDQLLKTVARYENDPPARPRAQPSIR